MARTEGQWQKGISFISPSEDVPVLLKNTYLNFGGVSIGESGYGIRDNAGTIEVKSSGGSWSTISTGGGEANTAANLGAGEGIYASKIGVALNFKSLVAGTGMGLSSDGNTITLTATSGSGDVVGPTGAVDSRIAVFDTTTGKLLKDGGKTIAEVLNTDNHTDGTTNKVFTAAEKTKLGNVETNADVTDVVNVGSSIHGATAKTTPVDADTMPLIDSAASNVLKKVTWANIKATIKAYTDTLYAAALGADDNYVTDAEKTKLGHISITQAVDLDALETASHAAVTVADSSEIDLTLTGQQISASIVAGSIDETKLDVSVNASLDLADSAVQPAGLSGYFQTANIDDTPVNGETAAPISSNWAYDHENSTTAHGATGAVVGTTNTQTLTNKRITQRVVTTTDDATAVIDVDVTDQYQLTAMANATTLSTTGTPTAGQKLMIRLEDNGTGRALTWDAVFRAIGVTLPTTTVATKTHYIGCVYNATDSKWDVLAVGAEA